MFHKKKESSEEIQGLYRKSRLRTMKGLFEISVLFFSCQRGNEEIEQENSELYILHHFEFSHSGFTHS